MTLISRLMTLWLRLTYRHQTTIAKSLKHLCQRTSIQLKPHSIRLNKLIAIKDNDTHGWIRQYHFVVLKGKRELQGKLEWCNGEIVSCSIERPLNSTFKSVDLKQAANDSGQVIPFPDNSQS